MPEIRDLIEWLSEQGFNVVSDRSFEGFGDRSIVLSKNPISIRITRDRGIWMISIAQPCETPSDSDDIWFEPKIWASYLDGTVPWTAPTPLEMQIKFVRTRISELTAALLQGDDGIEKCLRELRRSEFQTRFRSFRQGD
jgi:hypothetical protein